MKKKIGLYGGSFDPIHFGHLNLAIEIMEKHRLDEIWFCPAFINPHKLQSTPQASTQHRFKMLELALSLLPAFKIIDAEIGKESPSYTIETLQNLLKESFKLNYELFLIIGEDSARTFFQWFQAEKIVQLTPILVGSRTFFANPELLQGSKTITEALKNGWTQTRIMEISSTEVRDRLKRGLYCGHLIPSETLCYINKNELYFTRGECKKN